MNWSDGIFAEYFLSPGETPGQFLTNNAWLVVILTIVVVLTLLTIGFWLFSQFLSILNRGDSTVHKSTRKPHPREEKRMPESVDATTKGKSLDWIKKEYPDALLMDAQTLIKEYKSGRRDFKNAYPTAIAPYETYFKWTVLDGVDFSRAMLYRAPFDGTSLREANFNGAYLEGASFRGAILQQANLSWADLSWADLSGADLSGANLSYASLQGVDLTKAKLKGAIVTSEQLENVRSLKNAVMPDGSKNE
jgi:hypothetical protein